MTNLSNFTNPALETLRLADSESRRLGHNFICTEQLLIGILCEETSAAAKYLTGKGLTQELAKQKVENIIGHGAGFLAQEIPNSPKLNKILKNAIELAKNKSPVMPEHLFKGILDLKEGIAYQIINETINFSEAQIFIDREIEQIIKARNEFGRFDVLDLSSETLNILVGTGFTKLEVQLDRISRQLTSISKALGDDGLIVSDRERLNEIQAQIKELKKRLENN